MSCFHPLPVYANDKIKGIQFAGSRGDGYTIDLRWAQAKPSLTGYSVAYNVYWSTNREDVFEEGVKFVITDANATTVSIGGFTPGDVYYFAVRATMYQSELYSLSQLPTTPDGCQIYPEAPLTSNITADSLLIPIDDIDLFPATGIVQIGAEFIRYTSKDIPAGNLIVGSPSNRGFYQTEPRLHTIDGYDGYRTYNNPFVRFFTGFDDLNIGVQLEENKFDYPNHARTDADGYRVRKDILTTDLSSTDADQEGFPAFDFAGWYRNDPRDILDGKCVGSYFGGEYNCADGYGGIGRRVRGYSVDDVNNMREEVLLQNTGEPVVLVRRLWKGITCSCVNSSRETPEYRCPRCFTPDTLINTQDGIRKIKDVNVGDYVLTMSGEFRRVTKCFISPYKGKMKTIQTSISTNPIVCTPEHPFFTLRGDHNLQRSCGPKCNEYIKTGDGISTRPYNVRKLPHGKWWARAQVNGGKRESLGTYETKEEAINVIKEYRKKHQKCGHELKWDEAKNISTNDWLVPKWFDGVEKINEISIPEKYLKQTHLSSERIGSTTFKVDKEFMWVVGMYIAEGSSGKREISFSLHSNETSFQDRLVKFFKKYGFNPKKNKQKDKNCVKVDIGSTNLASWFPDWLGHICYHKRIPQELMYLDAELTWDLIYGIYDGDGVKGENEIIQTSEILAVQLVELLHRVGQQPLVSRQRTNILTPKGNKRAVAYRVNWAKETLTHESRKGRWSYQNKNDFTILSRVNEVNEIDYDGLVYNLEVDGDHTYIVNGISVHNCFGTGLVTGYEQFYNPRRSDGRILVRFDPAVENFTRNEPGLENEYKPNSWTLSIPSIKDGDFLIRFNKDGTEEFRYEVLDVTRNKIVENNYGRQQLSLTRVRKTDPIYMWRAIRDTSTMPQELMTTLGMVPGPGGIPPHTHTIVINENIISLVQINQTTSVDQDHNHPIENGVVVPVLGHQHDIILMK